MKPERDPKYRAWIRTLPCAVPHCQSRHIEAAHVGPHGISQKSSDRSTIPLCTNHHRTGKDSYHKLGPRKFQQVHHLDIPSIVRRLNLKPLIRIEGDRFVGRLEDQEFVLSRVEHGIKPAIREVLRLCKDHRSGAAA
jgi:hypothetical protein